MEQAPSPWSRHRPAAMLANQDTMPALPDKTPHSNPLQDKGVYHKARQEPGPGGAERARALSTGAAATPR